MDKTRQQFEEFILRNRSMLSENPFRRDNDSGLYYYPNIRNAYFFWQASRESLEVELPKSYLNLNGYWCYDESEVDNVLISNGVKIKNE